MKIAGFKDQKGSPPFFFFRSSQGSMQSPSFSSAVPLQLVGTGPQCQPAVGAGVGMFSESFFGGVKDVSMDLPDKDVSCC